MHYPKKYGHKKRLVQLPATPAICSRSGPFYHKENQMGKLKITPHKTEDIVALINHIFFKQIPASFPSDTKEGLSPILKPCRTG